MTDRAAEPLPDPTRPGTGVVRRPVVLTDLVGQELTQNLTDGTQVPLLGLGQLPGLGNPEFLTDTTRELAAVVRDLLAVDIVAVLVRSWMELRELRRAAARTSGNDDRETVSLSRDLRPLHCRPWVEVSVPAAAPVPLKVQLEVVLRGTVHAVTATVADGRLVRLGSGRVDVTAEVSVNGQTLASRSGSFDPQLAVDLGAGIALPPLPAG